MTKTMLRGTPFDYEPKRVNRYFAEIVGTGIEVWKVQKFKRPSLNINKVEIPYMNEMQYVAGRYQWQEQQISFLDPIGPSTSIQLMEWVRLHAESLSGRMGYAAGYKKDIILTELDPTGVEVARFFMEQCQIVSIDFGENTYDDDGLTMIDVTIQPWRCILNY
jgi:hypothetical protein